MEAVKISRSDIEWVTNLKGICIVLVFLSHVSVFYGKELGIVSNLMEPFYVNAFFFVSGYLLFWKHLSKPAIDERANEYIIHGRGRKTIENLFFKIAVPSTLFSAAMLVPKKLMGGVK